MITTELIPIREQLERIEKKLDGNFKNQFLSINEVSKLTSLSPSTIRRATHGTGIFEYKAGPASPGGGGVLRGRVGRRRWCRPRRDILHLERGLAHHPNVDLP